jgi:hypothetical protein
MATTVATDIETHRPEHEQPQPAGRGPVDATRQPLDPRSFDPTLGLKRGADPYDDPTSSRAARPITSY